MFNHIRKVPYVSGNGKGGISYFAGGFSSQFGLETQIVAAMCRLTRARSLSLCSNEQSTLAYHVQMVSFRLQQSPLL